MQEKRYLHRLRLMTIQEEIDADLRDAMRLRDAERLSVLRMVKSALTNAAIEKRGAAGGLADSEARTWRDIWSAGHGISTIHDVPSVAELVERLAAEYRAACAVPASPALAVS